MTVVVPDRLPLEVPPGSAEALGEVVSDVAGAGFHLTVLSRRLGAPAAQAPGWLGADAAAAAAQVGVIAALAQDAVTAVLAGMHRLSAHADRLHEARRQVSALQREQDEDFAAAWSRLALLGDHDLGMTTELPQVVAVVEDLRATEESRRHRHAALLEAVADDAAVTAQVLADCCAVVGGRAAPGDAERVVAHLAARLPGWGDGELAAHGRALARALMTGSVGSGALEVAAERAVVLATAPAFAAALLTELGVEGLEVLLTALGSDSFGGSSAVARVMAAALGGAVPGEGGRGEVDAVLTATYVGPGDQSGPSDVVAAGMAAVLIAAVPGTRGGVRLETVVEWGRQLLRRERSQGVFAGAGAVPHDWDARTLDPAGLAVDILAAGGNSAPAAALLADRGMWEVLLARWWGDGGGALGELVVLAGADAGGHGRAAMRAGLEALGEGLADGGNPQDRTVDRQTAAAVTRPLAAGLALHATVVPELLGAAVEGEPVDRNGDGLRGLGYLTIDRTAAGIVERALHDRTAVQGVLDDTVPASAALPAVVLPSGYLAVQEYGQRLAQTLLAYELQREAAIKALVWKFTPLHLLTYVPGPIGVGAGVVEPFVARLLGTDGSWEIGPDHGLVFDREDAVRAALAHALAGSPDPAIADVAREARTAFDRVTAALGELDAPRAPETHWWDPVIEAAESLGTGRAEAVVEARRLRGK